MTWFRRGQSPQVMSLVYLSIIAVLMPVLLVYAIGCSLWCLGIAVVGKGSPESPYREAELS